METMKQPRRFSVILSLAAAAVLALASSSSASVELVVNGGFESGDFTGWTHTLGTVSAVPGSGYKAYLGGPGFGGIEQDIATTLGEKYLLSFQLGNADTSSATWSDLRVSWGGQVLFDGGRSSLPMTSWSYEVTGTGETTSLKFDLYNHTLYGDANRDNSVDLLDLTLLGKNWRGSDKVWGQGDFNFDGSVDLLDLTILGQNWRKTISDVSFDEFGLDDVSVSAIVPEPVAIIVWSLLGMVAAGYGVWRRP